MISIGRHVIGRGSGIAGAGAATLLTLGAALRAIVVPAYPRPVTPIETGSAGWILVGLAGSALLAAAAWQVSSSHPRAAIGLALLAAGWLLPSWVGWQIVPESLRPVLLAAAPLAVAGLGLVALSWPDHPQPKTSWLLRFAVPAAVIAAAVLALGYNPVADPACPTVCADLPAVLDGVLSTREAVVIASLLTICSAAAGIAGLAGARTPRLVRAGAAVGLAACAVAAVPALTNWASQRRSAPHPWLSAAIVLLVAAAVLISGRSAGHARQAVERLAQSLAGSGTALAAGSPIRSIAFCVPDDGRWVDAAGRSVSPLPAGRSGVVLPARGQPEIRLEFAGRRDAALALGELTMAARLALANARLTAVGRARLADVHASQRRIIDAADAERRRIERDLHDGAQQRLVSAALHLQHALSHADPDRSARLHQAETGVLEALAELRRLAHGVFPGSLVDEGLEAALDDLLAASSVPASLSVRLGRQIPADAAMAAYATVAGVLSSLPPDPGGAAKIRVDERPGGLEVRIGPLVLAAGVLPRLIGDAADRVGALSGTLVVQSEPSGESLVVAVIPCG